MLPQGVLKVRGAGCWWSAKPTTNIPILPSPPLWGRSQARFEPIKVKREHGFLTLRKPCMLPFVELPEMSKWSIIEHEMKKPNRKALA